MEKNKEKILTFLNENRSKNIVRARMAPRTLMKTIGVQRENLLTFINDEVRVIEDIWMKDNKVTFHNRDFEQVGVLYFEN